MPKANSEKRQNLLLILPGLEIGGTEKQAILMLNLLSAMPEYKGFQYGLLLLSDKATLLPLLDSNIKVFISPYKHTIPKLIWIVKQIRHFRPVTVYSLLAPANLIAALASYFYRRPNYFWGFRASAHTVGISVLRRVFHELGHRWLYHRVTGVICNSELVKEFISGVLKRDKDIYILPNLANIPPSKVSTHSPEQTRIELKIAAEQFVLLYVGRLAPDKSCHDLFAVLRQLIDFGYDVILFVVGDGEAKYRHGLEQEARELGVFERVRWVGEEIDPWPYYAIADCYISTSINEGSSNSLHEAQIMNIPCVASNVGDAQQVLAKEDICEPHDVAAFALAVDKHFISRDATNLRQREVDPNAIQAFRASNTKNAHELMRILLNTPMHN